LQLKTRVTFVKGMNQTLHSTNWRQPCNTYKKQT